MTLTKSQSQQLKEAYRRGIVREAFNSGTVPQAYGKIMKGGTGDATCCGIRPRIDRKR